MIDSGAILSSINMLQSENDDVRNVIVYVLRRMTEHGTIDYSCMIVVLTYSIQIASGLLSPMWALSCQSSICYRVGATTYAFLLSIF